MFEILRGTYTVTCLPENKLFQYHRCWENEVVIFFFLYSDLHISPFIVVTLLHISYPKASLFPIFQSLWGRRRAGKPPTSKILLNEGSRQVSNFNKLSDYFKMSNKNICLFRWKRKPKRNKENPTEIEKLSFPRMIKRSLWNVTYGEIVLKC